MLVVVVITVIVFGGTTARMLEVLGIRVGVEDEDASSDDETGQHWSAMSGGMALQVGPGSRRYAGQNGRSLSGRGRAGRGVVGLDDDGTGYEDAEEGGYLHSPQGTPNMSGASGNAYRTSGANFNNPPRSANAALIRGFSTVSSSEEDNDERSDDGELFPSALSLNDHDLDPPSRHSLSSHPSTPGPSSSREGMVFRDGQWFTALDERYLLPLFSNSVASRRHHAKKANRRASGRNASGDGGSGSNSPAMMGAELAGYGEDETDEGEGGDIGGERDSENGKGKRKGGDRNFRSVVSSSRASPGRAVRGEADSRPLS